MKISVVIPAYNEEQLLSRCLESIDNQNFPRDQYEIIVVDNNSFDNTFNIAENYGAKVLFEQKRGVVYARQTGIENAKGKIIVGLDADCEIPPNFLKNISDQFKNKYLTGLCGNIYFDNAPLIPTILAKIMANYGHYYSKLFKRTPFCWAANFSFRKKDFQQVGGYNLYLPLLRAGINAQRSDEYDFVSKLLKRKKKVVFDKKIMLKTSGRRFKDRLVYWFFVEYLIGYIINENLYKLSGRLIPISVYERVLPNKVYYLSFLSIFTMSIIYAYFSLIISKSLNPEVPVNFISQKAHAEIKKIINLKSDIGSLSGVLNIKEKISPYLNQEVVGN